MILRKEFYFLRHGETNHNANNILAGRDCDVPLNHRGWEQSFYVRPTIKALPLDAICHSPLTRAKQTMEIVAEGHNCKKIEIEKLRECLGEIWLKMTRSTPHCCPHVENFFKQVLIGINQALAYGKQTLIVAHGGVHWALCYHMAIQNHPWKIGNCELVRFRPVGDSEWVAELFVENEVVN